MSNLVNQAAIMAPPPNAPSQAGAAPNGVPSFTLQSIASYVAMGGIFWIGGKAAASLWSYLGLDKKPKRRSRAEWLAHEASETEEEEEAEHEDSPPEEEEEEDNPEEEEEEEPDEDDEDEDEDDDE